MTSHPPRHIFRANLALRQPITHYVLRMRTPRNLTFYPANPSYSRQALTFYDSRFTCGIRGWRRACDIQYPIPHTLPFAGEARNFTGRIVTRLEEI